MAFSTIVLSRSSFPIYCRKPFLLVGAPQKLLPNNPIIKYNAFCTVGWTRRHQTRLSPTTTLKTKKRPYSTSDKLNYGNIEIKKLENQLTDKISNVAEKIDKSVIEKVPSVGEKAEKVVAMKDINVATELTVGQSPTQKENLIVEKILEKATPIKETIEPVNAQTTPETNQVDASDQSSATNNKNPKEGFFEQNPRGLLSSSRIRFWDLPAFPMALIFTALAITGVGIYQFYNSNVHKYPEAVRKNLQKGLFHQNYANNPNKAVNFYQQALTEALNSQELDNGSPEVTGIMIQLGGLLEELGRTRDAVDVLRMAYDAIVTPNNVPVKLENENLIKSVGLAQKLGDLYQILKQDELAEKYYVWSVGQLLTAQNEGSNHEKSEENGKGSGNGTRSFFGKKLDVDSLPSWMTLTDLGASLEALASFYSSRNKYTNALPLYFRALSLVDSEEYPCHSAVLMNNISEVFTGMNDLELAQGWAERGLRVTQEEARLQKKNSKECVESCGVLLFNLGMIAELSGDLTKAMEYYEKSRVHAKSIGFTDCVAEADTALQRVTVILNNSGDDDGISSKP